MIVTDMKLGIYDDEKALFNAISSKCAFTPYNYKILRRSIDARHGQINYVYTVEVLKNASDKFIDYTPEISKIMPKKRPVIVGAGPAGLFCAYVLAKAGARPIVIERGKCVELRQKDVDSFKKNGILNTESNVQYGEGGAGTFSDGKLMSGINDSLMRYVSDIFIECGAQKEISYIAKPHIGTDVLVKVIKNLRLEIEKNGGSVIFESKLSDVVIKNNCVSSIIANDTYDTDDLVLAIGHSAYDTFSMLHKKGINIIEKPFSIGMRIEHSQSKINSCRYGKNADIEKLGAADYKLSYHTQKNRGVYTFCMCPGGFVVASSSSEGGIVTNGMSYSDRAGSNANSALLVGINTDDFKNGNPLSGFDFQRRIEEKAFKMGGENYFAPCQLLEDYLEGKITKSFKDVKPTYQPGVAFGDLNKLFPSYVNEAIKESVPVFERKLRDFSYGGAVLTAPETRSSSPVKIPRNDRYVCNVDGIYPIGEGAGYAGGITSSAVDGVKCALNIIDKYKHN